MLDTESDFGLRWLFHPNSDEFLPIEDQLKKYKTRNLAKTKIYTTATKLWGLSRSRKRIFIAPPMGDHPGRDINLRQTNVKLKALPDKPRTPPPKNSDWALSELEKIALHEREVEVKCSEYKGWLEDRVKLRNGLESLRLSEDWLRNKPDPTPLERRVVDQMKEERINKQLSKQEREQRAYDKKRGKEPTTISLDVPSTDQVTPGIKQPPPEAMAIIAKYLSAKRQRLIDLFTTADKDKSWTLTRIEFKKCIKESGIPISSQLLSDLLESLDQDGNEVIDYREFVQGMMYFKTEERKRVSMGLQKSKEKRTDIVSSAELLTLSELPGKQSASVSAASAESSSQSPTDVTSRSSSPYLLPPPLDLTERRELEPDDMIEKRKREKYHSDVQKKKKKGKGKCVGKVRTGNPFIDSHSMRSTLGGDTVLGINKYREARLKEYHDICKLCEKNDIDLTPKLLERALLHPGDKPVSRIRNHVRQPGTYTLSEHFADPRSP